MLISSLIHDIDRLLIFILLLSSSMSLGILVSVAMNPIWVLKTRFQLQTRSTAATNYKGLFCSSSFQGVPPITHHSHTYRGCRRCIKDLGSRRDEGFVSRSGSRNPAIDKSRSDPIRGLRRAEEVIVRLRGKDG